MTETNEAVVEVLLDENRRAVLPMARHDLYLAHEEWDGTVILRPVLAVIVPHRSRRSER